MAAFSQQQPRRLMVVTFKDGDGTLVVVGSSGQLWSDDINTRANNHLYALKNCDGKLVEVSSIHDFGIGEDVRSVRFSGSLAYVVTFKKTDPLFAFDLSDLKAPKQLGELKIPGFSTYMHPISAERMIGLGFDAQDMGSFAWYQGIQLSLFDTHDPTKLDRLDNKVLGSRGSYSDATSNHHAFYFDAERQLIGFPLHEVTGGEGGYAGQEVKFTGAILFKIDGDSLVERARLSHRNIMPDDSALSRGGWWEDEFQSQDINRLYTVDDRLITVSRYGIKAFSLDRFEGIGEGLKFADESESRPEDDDLD